MKSKILFIFILLTISVGAYEVESIDLSSDLNSSISNSFPTNIHKINALIHIKDISKPEAITIFWISKDSLAKPNTILAKSSKLLNKDIKKVHFSYNKSANLPKGHYVIEVFSRDKKLAQKIFTLYSFNKPILSNTPKKATNHTLDISKIYLATAIKQNPDKTITPIGNSDHFENRQHTIYAIIPFENIKEDTPFSIEWIIVDNGIERNRLLYKDTGEIHYIGNNKKGTYVANITSPQDWRSGIYKFVFKIKGEVVAQKRFTIGQIEQKPSTQSINPTLEEKLIKKLASWMLETIKLRDIRPLYEHSLHGWRDRHDWRSVKQGFENIFNSGLNWEKILTQKPKLRPAKYLGNGAIRLQAIYPGVDSVDILLEGTFFKEGNEWRIFGFALEPLENQ